MIQNIKIIIPAAQLLDDLFFLDDLPIHQIWITNNLPIFYNSSTFTFKNIRRFSHIRQSPSKNSRQIHFKFYMSILNSSSMSLIGLLSEIIFLLYITTYTLKMGASISAKTLWTISYSPTILVRAGWASTASLSLLWNLSRFSKDIFFSNLETLCYLCDSGSMALRNLYRMIAY